MSTKKGLTTKALAKATKRLLDDIPGGTTKKRKSDENVLSKKATTSLINLHEQVLKDNKALSRKINSLQKVIDDQQIKITTMGTDKSVSDPISTKETSPEEEEVDESPVNIPKSYSLFSGMEGNGTIEYESAMLEPEDEGVFESIDEFVGKNKIKIQSEAMQSTYTIDLCFFGDKPQPLNKQKFRNYMEKFEVNDYQIPDLPVTAKSLDG